MINLVKYKLKQKETIRTERGSLKYFKRIIKMKLKVTITVDLTKLQDNLKLSLKQDL